jgi:hypothetical protein
MDGLCEGKGNGVPFVGARHPATAHILFLLDLKPGQAVVFVARPTGIGLEALSGIDTPAGSSSHSLDLPHISARRLSQPRRPARDP